MLGKMSGKNEKRLARDTYANANYLHLKQCIQMCQTTNLRFFYSFFTLARTIIAFDLGYAHARSHFRNEPQILMKTVTPQ